MSVPLLFLTVGLLSLALLCIFVLRMTATRGGIQNLSEANETLSELQSELLPGWFVERLFSEEDWKFSRSLASSHIPTLFDLERKTIALLWLKQTREHIACLMDFHLRMARQRADLRPAVEIKLMLEYMQFQLLCKILGALIKAMGPIHVRRVAGYAVRVATHLGKVSEKVLEGLNDTVPVNAGGS